MGFIKNLAFKAFLNKEQRTVIYQALIYSEHVYKRRGNVDKAVKVKSVIEQTRKLFGFSNTFTEEEVTNIVENVRKDNEKLLADAFNRGAAVAEQKLREVFAAGFNSCLKKVREDSSKHLELLGTVNLNDCEKCEHKDDCLVRKAILEIEAEEEEEKKNEEGSHQEDDSSKSKDNDEEGSKKDESSDEEKKEE